jgi:hypothetical protein
MELFGATINFVGGVGMTAVEGIRSCLFGPSTPPSTGGGGGF